MCGICGVLNFDPASPVDRSVIQRMNDQILHRRPDEDGFFVSENVAMAMPRLSIIDLTSGQQPIGNEDGSILNVFSGEIGGFRRPGPADASCLSPDDASSYNFQAERADCRPVARRNEWKPN